MELFRWTTCKAYTWVKKNYTDYRQTKHLLLSSVSSPLSNDFLRQIAYFERTVPFKKSYPYRHLNHIYWLISSSKKCVSSRSGRPAIYPFIIYFQNVLITGPRWSSLYFFILWRLKMKNGRKKIVPMNDLQNLPMSKKILHLHIFCFRLFQVPLLNDSLPEIARWTDSLHFTSDKSYLFQCRHLSHIFRWR